MSPERIESSQFGRQDDGLRAKTSERRRDGGASTGMWPNRTRPIRIMSEEGVLVRPLMGAHPGTGNRRGSHLTIPAPYESA